MEVEACYLPHVMLVSFPGQGHVNPLLRLGKLLASKGLLITFVTTESWGKKMRIANKIQDGVLKPLGKGFVRFEFFHDGLPEDDEASRHDFTVLRPHLEVIGKREIKKLVKRYEEEEVKQRVTCLINNPFVSWVCDVADELQIPCAVLWVQSCACLAAYYYYHHQLVKFPTKTEPEIEVQIPCMPLLKHDEIPTFLHPSTPYIALADVILDQIKRLDKTFSLLIDSFDSLEEDIIGHMSKLCPNIIRPIGPLFKMAKTVTKTDIRGDISEVTDDCMEWLNSQPVSSVVYISFGTVAYLKQEQIEEIAQGVLKAGVSFLWVMRPQELGFNKEPHVLPQEVKDKGKIVEWCPQEKVLAHPAVSCFVTHCGWNSTMETLSSGLPIVCFPQWGDQVTNAVYLIDVFKIGVRLGRGEAEERVVSREEVAEKLLEVTKGEKSKELKKNALKWKTEAETAVAYGGSSEKKFEEFVEKLGVKPILKVNGSNNNVLSLIH